jgi:hypothetical protein
VRSSMARSPNPKWVIDCRNCHATITHSEIGSECKLIDYLFLTKPEFPIEGTELECPACRVKAVYTQTDLRYESH